MTGYLDLDRQQKNNDRVSLVGSSPLKAAKPPVAYATQV